MRPSFVLGLAAASLLVASPPVQAQDAESESAAWELSGIRSAFCIQLLLAPTSALLGDLPGGYHPLPASAAGDLHISLRSVIESQTEFAAWSPSRLCFTMVDTVRTRDFSLTDKSGRRPQLFAVWTVLAAGPSGAAQDVSLGLFANNGRLIRSARLAGQEVKEARVAVGKVPVEDENGVPSADDRLELKLGGSTVTWDGRLAADSVAVTEPVRSAWAGNSVKASVVNSSVTLVPTYAHAMTGSLKVDGSSELAKALRASPTRFAGPSYRGGTGTVSLGH